MMRFNKMMLLIAACLQSANFHGVVNLESAVLAPFNVLGVVGFLPHARNIDIGSKIRFAFQFTTYFRDSWCGVSLREPPSSLHNDYTGP